MCLTNQSNFLFIAKSPRPVYHIHFEWGIDLLLSLSSEPERLLSLVLLVRGAPADAPSASVTDLPRASTAEDDGLTPAEMITSTVCHTQEISYIPWLKITQYITNTYTRNWLLTQHI